jgi:SAM-dependent methyltransferase
VSRDPGPATGPSQVPAGGPDEADADLAYRGEPPDPAAGAVLADAAAGRRAVDPAIHRCDEMLRWALWSRLGSRQQALFNYFRCGASAWRVLRTILSRRFAGRDAPAILDFAAGYGRITRFLAAEHPPDRVTVADVDPEAVAFQVRRFGVGGMVSPHRPEALAAAGPFDAVLAASFFSHLPEATFPAWLARLWRLVAPGGLLAFSVHDEAVLPPGRRLPEAGHHFEEVSETASLDLAEYGSSWVSEPFVARAITAATDGKARYRRLPLALWHLQDLYVVADGGEALSGLAVPREPDGYLDRCEWSAGGRVVLGGWAVDRDHGEPVVRVEVTLGDQTAAVAPDRDRPDVAARLGPDALTSEWRVEFPADRRSADDLLLVKAHTRAGVSGLLHAGQLEASAAFVALVRTEQERRRLAADLELERVVARGVRRALADESARVAELDRGVHELGWEKHVLSERIRGMEASRFWRLRERWFRIKRRCGRGRDNR